MTQPSRFHRHQLVSAQKVATSNIASFGRQYFGGRLDCTRIALNFLGQRDETSKHNNKTHTHTYISNIFQVTVMPRKWNGNGLLGATVRS